MEEDFDWFSDTIECEDEFMEEDKYDKSLTNSTFDHLHKLIIYVAGVLLTVFILRIILNYNTYLIVGIDLNFALLSCGLYLLLLVVLTNSSYMALKILKPLGTSRINKRVEVGYRWSIATIWFLIGVKFLHSFKGEFRPIYKNTKHFLQSGILTSVTFLLLNVGMDIFFESFVTQSLKKRMGDVSKSENILALMKSYQVELYEPETELSGGEGICTNLFCNDITIREDLSTYGAKTTVYGNIVYNKPELPDLLSAKKLAMNTFIKAARGDSELTFRKFRCIFPTKELALKSFHYFDINSDSTISKSEFKDTVIRFYVLRKNLEKSFTVTRKFIENISNATMICVFVLLCLCYLVIFGIPIKELVALSFSSAILINFTLSGVATEFYSNVILLISHPFDIGDDIIIDCRNYKIHSIGLYSTSLIAENGGIVKMLNKNLAHKNIYNMTSSPKSLLLFTFTIVPNNTIDTFILIKKRIKKYLKERKFDFNPDFSFRTQTADLKSIDKINCEVVLEMRMYKHSTKRFLLRAEFSEYITEVLESIKVE